MFAYYTLIYIFLVLVWAGIVYLLFLTVQNRRYRAWLEKQKMTTILLKVPKNNEKTALSAEQMYASLHGILRDKWKLFVAGELQEHFSFEIVSSSKYIKFYATVPNQLVDFLEGQIYAQYPTLLIEKVGDYVVDYDRTGRNFASCELVLDRNEVYPIRTFDSFEVDPLAGVTAVLSKLGDSKNQIWIQFLMRPVDNSWQSKCKLQVKKIKGEASKGGIWGMMWRIVSMLIQHVITSGAGDTSDGKSSAKELTAPEEEAIKGIYEKSTKLGYQSKIRVVCFADDKDDAKSKINSIVGTFKQFSITNMNGFSARRINVNKKNDLDAYEKRSFWDKGYILNVKELASLFHLPSIAVATPAIVWSTAKTAEPPSNLPTIANTNKDDLTIFACTNFRGLEHNFGLKIGDRSHHTYIVGKTGMGKTSLLQNMVIDDIRKGRGVAVVDPHGDFVDTVLDYIPKSRINDVILFDPGDKDNPVAFNLLEQVDDDYKPIIASGLVGIFKKLFADSWGPRLEHILRYTFLALLD
nr:type IV secretion system DNA-binding domain-containing protein [bacterium]